LPAIIPRVAPSSSTTDLLRDLADRCVACGLCLPHCPTYADVRQEAESPRGRIALARALARGSIGIDEAAQGDSLGHCLGCRACETACPAKVDYGQILVLTRTLLRGGRPPRWRQRAVEWLLAGPRRTAAALGLAGSLVRLPGARRLLPRIPATRAMPRLTAATAPRRGRVFLYEGCVARRLESPAHQAARVLLARLGWEVVVDPSAGCCGSLHGHGGDAGTARRLQENLGKILRRQAVDLVLLASSGCFESVRRAAAGRPVEELTAFLADQEALRSLPFRPLTHRVALHTPCTQRNVVKRAASARDLLRHIPGLVLLDDGPRGCCGAGGIQRLLHPDQALRHASPWLDWARRGGATVVASSNIGCRVHLALSRRPGHDVLAFCHPLELLAEALECP